MNGDSISKENREVETMMLRVHSDDSGGYTIEPILPGVAFPVPPRCSFDSLPEWVKLSISLLLASDGGAIPNVGKTISENEFLIEEGFIAESLTNESADIERRDLPHSKPLDGIQW